MRFVSAGHSDAGAPLPLDDPLAERLRALTVRATTPEAVVDALLGVREVFGDDLPAQPVLRALLVEALADLTRHGAAATARAWA